MEQIDALIIQKLAERKAISIQMAQLKIHNGLDIIDLDRENKNFQLYEQLCKEYQVPYDMVKQLFHIIITHSRMIQESIKLQN